MELGVVTHFSHDWPTYVVEALEQHGVSNIRDNYYWSEVEKEAGVYNFPDKHSNSVLRAANKGIKPLIVLGFDNKFYDQGFAPYTDAGRKAFANYCVEVISNGNGKIEAVEIWNEYNGAFAKGMATNDRAYYYTLMLKEAYAAIKKAHPQVTVVGASTVFIPLPFMKKLFDHDALKYMDAISVHPYRGVPEGIDAEVSNLKELMASYGHDKPIWVTEFGEIGEYGEPNDQAASPHYLLKIVSQMSSSHVQKAYWYSFLDSEGFKMGLTDSDLDPKPVMATFRMLNETLLPQGNAVRQNFGDNRTFLYHYPSDYSVLWGYKVPIKLSGNYTALDATGKLATVPKLLNGEPLVIKGQFSISRDPSKLIADTFLDFQQPGWSYYGETQDGKLTPLVEHSNDWGTFLSHSGFNQMGVSAHRAHPGWEDGPVTVVERFTVPNDTVAVINGEWETSTKGDGVEVSIRVSGKTIWNYTSGGKYSFSDIVVNLHAGDTLDFMIGPNKDLNWDVTYPRFQVVSIDNTQLKQAD